MQDQLDALSGQGDTRAFYGAFFHAGFEVVGVEELVFGVAQGLPVGVRVQIKKLFRMTKSIHRALRRFVSQVLADMGTYPGYQHLSVLITHRASLCSLNVATTIHISSR